MPVIGHISNGASSERAISYGFGKNQRMKNNTEQWLADNGVKVDFPYIGYSSNSRAVWVGGTNGIDGYHASADMAFNQSIHNQTKKKNQVMCIVQSFSHNELDPLNPADWEKANKLGVEFAKKAYPDYQCAVFTQIDNKNHLVHNHIYVDKVNLITGHKLKEPRRLNDFYAINDEISREQGWKVIPPKREHKLNAENKKKKPGRKAFVSYVKETVDSLMMSDEITSKTDFIKALDQKDIIYDDKNKLNRFVSKTEKDKSGKAFVVRGKRLGTDYEKEAIDNELELRSRKQATHGREPIFERRIERTTETERNYLKSEQDYLESERDNKDVETCKQQAEADDTKLSVFRNLMGQLEEKYREFVEFFKNYKKNSLMYDLYGDKGMKQEAMKAFEYRDKSSYHAEKTKKTKEQEPYTLQFNSKLIGPAEFVTVNPKTKTIGIGESQGSNIKKIPEKTTFLKRKELKNEIERLSGSYQVLNDIDGHEKGSLNEINAFNDELPINAILENPKQLKKPKQQVQTKKQTPIRRTSHRRLQIKKNQNQNKNIDRGPKM